MNNELTLNEAVEQGYMSYIFAKEGFQTIRYLVDITEEEFNREDIRLVEKEAYHPAGMSSKDIAEYLAEYLECNHSDESGDDTEAVYDVIKELDFSEAENKISEALSKLNYYRATNIKLIP